jgi:hypothetical protein
MTISIRPVVLAFAGYLFLSALVPAAFAGDCYTQCVDGYGCYGSHPFAGTDCANLCQRQCQPDGWGALAYSWKERVFGYSFALSDKHTAEQSAMQSCRNAHGTVCEVETSYYELCAAVAADGQLVGWGTAKNKSDASQRALTECSNQGGKHCLLEASVCSARNPNTTAGPNTPMRNAPPKAIAWGAIAYSVHDMGAGYSQGQADRASAEKQAMEICGQRGKACVLEATFNKTCGALAADRNFAGTGISTDQREAMQKAIAACKSAGGTACVLHILFCSF